MDRNSQPYFKTGSAPQWGFSLNRFEGHNNEPDMETPYAYVYAGRHDRTAEVVRGYELLFVYDWAGGLPGNDESGGLSSCCVWNAVGLFPITGQSIVLIGSPLHDSISMKIGNNTLVIQTINNSDRGTSSRVRPLTVCRSVGPVCRSRRYLAAAT